MLSFYLRWMARFAAPVVLAMACAGGSAAQPAAPLQLAALVPGDTAVAPVLRPAIPGPFGLPTAVAGAYAARWQSLQPLLRIEAQMLAMCRTHPNGCPAPATKFLRILDEARGLDGRARVGAINRAVNLAIRPQSDELHYGVTDLWASPLTTFASGAGDCEDYAIAKYVALRAAGLAASDVRLVVVRDRDSGDEHAVTAARVDGDWLLLDNRHLRLLKDSEAASLAALAALGEPPQPDDPVAASGPPALLEGDFSV